MKVKNMNGDIWLINEQTNNTEINESISCSHVIIIKKKDDTLLHLEIFKYAYLALSCSMEQCSLILILY